MPTTSLLDCHFHLRGQDLSGLDLRGANLTGANLAETVLARRDLSGTKLVGAGLVDADLRRAKLVGADFSDADLTRANFAGADLEGVFGTPRSVWRAKLTGSRSVPWHSLIGVDTEKLGTLSVAAISSAVNSVRSVAWHRQGDLLATAHDDARCGCGTCRAVRSCAAFHTMRGSVASSSTDQAASWPVAVKAAR